MQNPYLLLWFEANLQSWGHDSKFGRRDTLNFPTKSGVLGLVCSALGAGGEQCDLLNDFSSLNMEVISFKKTTSKGQSREREPLMCDFQMVGGGYDDSDPWQTMLIPKTSDGKKATNSPGTKMTFRYYLQDAVFAVILETPINNAAEVAQALKTPHWDIYLGRKTCIPNEIIFQGQFSSVDEAKKKALDIAQQKQLLVDFNVLQGYHDKGEILTLNDVPVQFGVHKKYRDRQVTIIYRNEE